ncbi:alpha-L-fucosidase [Lentisphaera marina]|uniref:alpha-L-fucosidase n=1 Tax=Lentisphaera marina TaxID=1111041 RepID=UPI002366C4B3|nr:alpha-L-fucosidase [Lentisphaera marina]MDD7983896.1 alpha-L-fucosidase [Lentisphaera marina]
MKKSIKKNCLLMGLKTSLMMSTLMSTNTSASGVNGSGIPGSEEMLELEAKWKPLNHSAAKQRGRERFNDNKYGMFIHWGLYSQCGGVWKGEKMEEGPGTGPRVAEWIMRRKEIPREEYAKLAKTFNPVNFDADEWVAIAKAAGMKYMVITSKHHDGFALFDSKVSDFNVVKATPFKRDIIRELEEACRKGGLAFGVYYSHALDWRDGGDSGMKDYAYHEKPQKKLFVNHFDPSPVKFDDYIANKSLPQVRELVNNYDLKEIWLDTPIYIPPSYSFEFYKTIYAANPETLVSQRIGNGFGDIGTPGDNVIPDEASENTWEGIATTNNSWGYKSYDKDWKSPKETLYWLVENVSKGGNFLLNVGPDGSGTIPAKSVENLKAVGQWLKINGEAIYGTKPWIKNHEGPSDLKMKGTHHRSKEKFDFVFSENDFWFTKKDEKVYVIAMTKPQNNVAFIKSLEAIDIKAIRLLGQDDEVKWTQKNGALEVRLPKFKTAGIGYALEISL